MPNGGGHDCGGVPGSFASVGIPPFPTCDPPGHQVGQHPARNGRLRQADRLWLLRPDQSGAEQAHNTGRDALLDGWFFLLFKRFLWIFKIQKTSDFYFFEFFIFFILDFLKLKKSSDFYNLIFHIYLSFYF